jgi:hypothetical protein
VQVDSLGEIKTKSTPGVSALKLNPKTLKSRARTTMGASEAVSLLSYSHETVANRNGISGGRSLTRPFRDARRFPSTRLYPVLRATRTPRKPGRCPSFKGQFMPPRAKPECFDSQLCHRCVRRDPVWGGLGVSHTEATSESGRSLERAEWERERAKLGPLLTRGAVDRSACTP